MEVFVYRRIRMTVRRANRIVGLYSERHDRNMRGPRRRASEPGRSGRVPPRRRPARVRNRAAPHSVHTADLVGTHSQSVLF